MLRQSQQLFYMLFSRNGLYCLKKNLVFYQCQLPALCKGWDMLFKTGINTMRPATNGSHFIDKIFKCIFVKDNFSYLNEWMVNSKSMHKKFNPSETQARFFIGEHDWYHHYRWTGSSQVLLIHEEWFKLPVIDGLVQHCIIVSILAMEVMQSCTMPLISELQ